MSRSSPLSKRVQEKIQIRFQSSEYDKVAELLLRYGENDWEPEVDRIRFDVLEICDSSVARVEALIALAQTDYRDLIVAAEYVRDPHGNLVLKPQFQRRG